MAELAIVSDDTANDALVPGTARPGFTRVPLDRIRLHPLNVRKELRNLEELADSIRQHGLLQPLVLVPDPEPREDGEQGFLLVAGHRRHAASVIANHDPVEAIIRQDLDSDGAQILAMLTENGPRDDLTPIEEANGYQLALALNQLTPAKLAERLGKPRSHIKSRIALNKLPDAIQERLHARQISLTEAEAMVEFADDTGATERLNAVAGNGNFDWKLREERDRRAKARLRAALLADLKKAGTKIIERPQDDYESTARPVGRLYVDERSERKVDEEVHQSTCPYASVAIVDAWDGPQAISYCTDPEAAGHHLPKWATGTSQVGSNGTRQETAAELRWRQEREERDRQHSIAGTLRGDFLTALNLKPKANQVAILRLLARHWIPPFLKETKVIADRSLAGITVADIEHLGASFGVAIPKHPTQGRPGTKAQEARDLEAARNSWPLFEAAIAKGTAEQLLHGLVSVARLELEASTRRNYGDRYNEAPFYLATLDGLGYQPSDAERNLRQQLTKDRSADVDEGADDEGDRDGTGPSAPDGSCPVCGDLVEAAVGETYRCPNGHESSLEDLKGVEATA
jgi:ParB/RepB/Spo0J family partition protein